MKQYLGNGLWAEWDGQAMTVSAPLENTKSTVYLDSVQMLELNRFWQLCVFAKRVGLIKSPASEARPSETLADWQAEHAKQMAVRETQKSALACGPQNLNIHTAAAIVYGRDHYSEALPSFKARA